MVIVNLILAIIPGILIGWFIQHKDKNKESKGLLIKLFLGGVASCFLTLLISGGVKLIIPNAIPGVGVKNTNIVILFFQVLCGIALIEEFCKWFFSYIIGYRHHEFDETFDAIVYCTFVSLGFAVFENVLYVFAMDDQLMTALLRAFTAVPGHVCDAIVMGYFLGMAKRSAVNGYPGKTKYLILSILMPTIIHGLYDFLILSGSIVLVCIWLIFIICVYIYAIKKVNKISKTGGTIVDYQVPVQGMNVMPTINQQVDMVPSSPVTNSPKICEGCGSPVNTPFCMYCGKKQ